jgi:predicted nucleic acid-binding protein
MHRVFLDANVLFSCAYLSTSRLLKLWRLPATVLLSSDYAVEEARRNLDLADHRHRLEQLVKRMEIVTAWQSVSLPRGVRLDDNDVPILLAAIEARATHLLTGDRKDFGHLYGKIVGGVEILPPAEYLSRRSQTTR